MIEASSPLRADRASDAPLLRGVVVALAKGGRGIVRNPAGTVFLDAVVPGEEVEYTLTGVRRGGALEGRLRGVLTPSPERVFPRCPLTNRCGGCNLQHISITGQRSGKKQILAANLARIGGLPPDLPIETIASEPWRSRTHAEFRLRDGRPGFYRRGSHDLIAIEDCLLVPEVIFDWIRESFRPPPCPDDQELAVVTDGEQWGARLRHGGSESFYGQQPAIEFDLSPFHLRVRPGTFVQANRFLLKPMQQLVRETVRSYRVERAVDLFAGGGFFTLPLALETGRVTAVEVSAAHGELLRENIERNSLNNVIWQVGDALVTPPPPADLYLLDPPRGGLSARLIRHLTEARPRAILYFSCDSATLARDLGQFSNRGFSFRRIVLLDNYPQTDHLETFVVLAPD